MAKGLLAILYNITDGKVIDDVHVQNRNRKGVDYSYPATVESKKVLRMANMNHSSPLRAYEEEALCNGLLAFEVEHISLYPSLLTSA